MRANLMVVSIGLIILSSPVLAGTLTLNNGQTSWQSTQCKEPVEPPSLVSVNPETRANNMNIIVMQYNQYAQSMQAYMDCLSNEAQGDSAATTDAITNSAQAMIQDAQKKLSSVGSVVQQPAHAWPNKPVVIE